MPYLVDCVEATTSLCILDVYDLYLEAVAGFNITLMNAAAFCGTSKSIVSTHKYLFYISLLLLRLNIN